MKRLELENMRRQNHCVKWPVVRAVEGPLVPGALGEMRIKLALPA
jgi:hypothetical protein